MKGNRKVIDWIALVAVLTVALGGAYLIHLRKKSPVMSVRGAVIRQDADLRKEIPIADVEISTANVFGASDCTSDASGFFWLDLPAGIAPGQSVTLLFRHPGYQSLELNAIAGDKVYVARMKPNSREPNEANDRPDIVVTNVDVRYSIKSTAVANVGSVVKTFQAVNTGNVPCNSRWPCSPDGRWKAATGSLSLDAGQGNEFRDARVSCIAGPCPFTKIGPHNFSHNGRTLNASALDWSDTATFLLEAEVDRPMVRNTGRESYPVTFGEALNFTLPVGAEGVVIEAEMNGTPIVFPLGPDLLLSWADCNARMNNDKTKAYRCALKPGYRFQ
jgi:hypothetical protein